MNNNNNFWNVYPLYMETPPIKVDPADGVLRRYAGGSTRCAFWAGYDGITTGPHTGIPGSVTRTGHKAGVAYRKLVDAGKRDPLPAQDA